MKRHTRCQGAVIRDGHLLLIKHREHATGRAYWVIPGGGPETDETGEECVARELWEETGLRVQVERLLLDDASPVRDDVYSRFKTYLCTAEGEPAPGYEPEEHAARIYAIVETGWFDLNNPAAWDPLVLIDPFTYPLLRRIRVALGFAEADG